MEHISRWIGLLSAALGALSVGSLLILFFDDGAQAVWHTLFSWYDTFVGWIFLYIEPVIYKIGELLNWPVSIPAYYKHLVIAFFAVVLPFTQVFLIHEERIRPSYLFGQSWPKWITVLTGVVSTISVTIFILVAPLWKPFQQIIAGDSFWGVFFRYWIFWLVVGGILILAVTGVILFRRTRDTFVLEKLAPLLAGVFLVITSAGLSRLGL